MKLLLNLVLAVALATAAPSLASARAPDEGAAVKRAIERGRLIHELDQAAWHSTDVLLAKLPKARHGEVKGWVVEPEGDALSVLYYGYDGETPYGVFSARFRDGKVLSWREIEPGQPRGVSDAQRQMAAARQALSGITIRPCTNGAFNTVVLPPASAAAPVEIYLLTPQMARYQYPFGGHFLLTIGPDGKIASTRPFMKSCLNQTLEPNVVASMVTLLLDPTPTEIHVWLARWTGKPVYVMVTEPAQLWEVTGAGMRKVDRPGG